MGFQEPSLDLWMIFYTAIGAFALWCSWLRRGYDPYFLSPFMRRLGLKSSESILIWIDLGLFVALGVVVGIGVVEPINPAQALAAGLGWTGTVTQFDRRQMKTGDKDATES